MDNHEFGELQEALKQFRLDVIKALAGIEVELYALQVAAIPGPTEGSIDADRWKQVHEKAVGLRAQFESEYEEMIAPAHTLRSDRR
jgi:hypothetical protein